MTMKSSNHWFRLNLTKIAAALIVIASLVATGTEIAAVASPAWSNTGADTEATPASRWPTE